MKNRAVLPFIVLALLLALGGLPGPVSRAAAPVAAVPSQAAGQQPEIGQAIVPAVFDGDLRSLPQLPGGQAQPRDIPLLTVPGREQPATDPDFRDPVVQNWQGEAQMPEPLIAFPGLQGSDAGSWVPPDTNGDVGLTHYVQVVNIGIGMFDKFTGERLVLISYNDFFDGTGTLCDYSNRGDVVVLYDQMAGRWLISDFGWVGSSGPYYECIAVSQSEDPVSGGWYFYALPANPNDPDSLNDYPKLGVWPDAYYMSANMYYGQVWGARVWALDRAAMINGEPMNWVAFSLGSAYWSLLPSNVRGAEPPAGAPNVFASLGDNLMRFWKFHVDWANPGNSTFTGPTNVSVAPFAYPGDVPQPAPGELVDSLGDRLMFQLQYRNFETHESLWVNHSVVSGGVTGVRWYEFRLPGGTPTLYQQGTYQPDGHHRWMGSVAVDGAGNMAAGYSVSSTTLKPSIRYAGRLVDDPLGTLPQAESSIMEGTGVQLAGSGRWGDYSCMTVDPADDCTFWYTNEYYQVDSNRNWQTYIGSFKFPSCGEPEIGLHIYRMKINWRTAMPPYYKVITMGITHDQNHTVVEGVTVAGEWTYPDGSLHGDTAVTDSLGRWKFRVKEPQCGLFTFCLTDMAKDGYAYDPDANEQGPCQQIQVTCQ